MQAQKEALQSGLVTMHDIEMMVVEDEGSITNLLTVVKQQCNMIAMALFGNVVGPLFANWSRRGSSSFTVFSPLGYISQSCISLGRWLCGFQTGGDGQGSSQPKLNKSARGFHLKKRAKLRLKNSSSKGNAYLCVNCTFEEHLYYFMGLCNGMKASPSTQDIIASHNTTISTAHYLKNHKLWAIYCTIEYLKLLGKNCHLICLMHAVMKAGKQVSEPMTTTGAEAEDAMMMQWQAGLLYISRAISYSWQSHPWRTLNKETPWGLVKLSDDGSAVDYWRALWSVLEFARG